MSTTAGKSLVGTGLTVVFLVVAALFYFDILGHPVPLLAIPATPPEFTNTATVRMSAAEVIRTGGDTSGMACYSCHDEKKPVVVRRDTNGAIVLPEAHSDMALKHGRSNLNDYCFNCHDPNNLVQLKPHEGQTFKLTESTLLCASCHGPTYRDWKIGIHGRMAGYWDRKQGGPVRKECTSCHDPHAPAFPPIKPGPGPHLLHPVATSHPADKEIH